MHRTKLIGAATLGALMLGGCVTVPVVETEAVMENGPREDRVAVLPPPHRSDLPPPVYAGDPRDTRPVDYPRIAVGPKPRFGGETSFTRQDAGLAYASFDDAVAVSEAIGDSPPDFAFRLYGSEAWAWTDASGEMLIVEGEGARMVQYFYAPRDDSPVFVRTNDFSFVYADGRLAGVLRNHGQLVEERLFNNLQAEGDRWLVRGRSLFHGASDRRWDRETAVRWSAVQPVYGNWVTSWIAPPNWSHHYELLRDREAARERRERRRRAREERRERAERFARWRNGGAIGAPPGAGNGAGGDPGAGAGEGAITPPRRPGQPGLPGTPARPPRPPREGGPGVPAVPPAAPPPADEPVRVVPPGPAVPTPMDPARPPRRLPPGWQGTPTEQPHVGELDSREGRRPDRVMPEGPTDEAAMLERQRAANEAAAQAAAAAEAAEAAERARQAREQAAEAAAAERAAAAAERAAEMRALEEQQSAAEAMARRQAEAERAEAERAEAQRAAQERADAQERAEAQRAAQERAAAEAAARQAAAERAAQRAAEERAAAEAAASRSPQQPRSVDESAENVRPE